MNEVVAADGHHVAVATNNPNIEIGASHCETRRNCGSASVDAMHSIGIHVVREPRCTANT